MRIAPGKTLVIENAQAQQSESQQNGSDGERCSHARHHDKPERNIHRFDNKRDGTPKEQINVNVIFFQMVDICGLFPPGLRVPSNAIPLSR